MNEVRVRHEVGRVQQAVSIGRHRLVSDASVAEGGEDAGPSPHELLAAALASCTAITLRMYSQRKAWPLENVEVGVRIEHEGERARFRRTIDLMGPLAPDQRARLLEIATRCPVHRTLTGQIEIETRLVEPETAFA